MQLQTMAEIIAEFRKDHGYRLGIGAALYLPDHDQQAEIVRVDFYVVKGSSRKRVVLVWRSECIHCGAEYLFETRRKFSYITRTCKVHRGQRMAKAAKPKADVVKPLSRRGVLERCVLEAVDTLLLVDAWAPRSEVEALAASLAPKPAGRDQRLPHARRALLSLLRRGEVAVSAAGLQRAASGAI